MPKYTVIGIPSGEDGVQETLPEIMARNLQMYHKILIYSFKKLSKFYNEIHNLKEIQIQTHHYHYSKDKGKERILRTARDSDISYIGMMYS